MGRISDFAANLEAQGMISRKEREYFDKWPERAMLSEQVDDMLVTMGKIAKSKKEQE